jgi:hypothetical protein
MTLVSRSGLYSVAYYLKLESNFRDTTERATYWLLGRDKIYHHIFFGIKFVTISQSFPPCLQWIALNFTNILVGHWSDNEESFSKNHCRYIYVQIFWWSIQFCNTVSIILPIISNSKMQHSVAPEYNLLTLN